MGEERKLELFNSSIESALRCLIIIDKMKPVNLDMLTIFDYLCLNSKDFGGPDSLHAPVPNRNVQILVRRKVIEEGLKILIAKELVNVKPLKGGIYYTSNKSTKLFVGYLESDYKNQLYIRLEWVYENFGDWSEVRLKKFVDENIEHWGEEISLEMIKN